MQDLPDAVTVFLEIGEQSIDAGTRLMKPCLHLLSPKCENSTMEKMYF